jgi:LmbE family N-acetylglucosaminyl deacetylase
MDPYREFLRRYEEALGATLPAPKPPPVSAFPPPAPGAPVALLFSPHPDDEILTGTLPLRLQREAGARVINIAVTLGSNPLRRDARRRELADACACLGWEFEILDWDGVHATSSEQNPDLWATRVHTIAEILRRWHPRWVFYPHAADAHPTHIGTHLLVNTALTEATGGAAPPWRVQTEYWHPNEEPNLLVECPPNLLAELVAALCCHRGEIARSPYHLTLPAWMIDNVRRGAESLAHRGAPAPSFHFGTLYRVEPAPPANWPSFLPASPPLTA